MVEGIGPIKLAKLIKGYGSIEEVCGLLSAPLGKAEEEIKMAEAQNIKILCLEDEEYPKLLKQIHDPPPIIYLKGNLSENIKHSIAIVGTRVATHYGLETAKRFAGELSSLGVTVVSGLALGIDSAAHEGSLEAGGNTIAVLGSGVDKIYPPSNSGLAAKILDAGGALISEFPIGFPPDSWTFPQRNRIISGLSLGVIVVEGNYDSGAMITAKVALEQGREVFAVPQNIGSEQGRGPHWLIKQGAKLVESIDDVLDELQHVLNIKRVMKSEVKRDYSNLKPEEQKIISYLSFEPKHIDMISNESGFSISEVSSLLLMLEVKKSIRQLPGKMFLLS